MKSENKVSESYDAIVSEDMTNENIEIDYSVNNTGPLYVDSRHKQPGHVYQFVSNEPGQIDMYKRWGYRVVDDPEIKAGRTTAASSSQFGSAVSVQSKCGRLLVLMSIRQDLFDKLMEFRDSQSRKLQEALRKSKIDGIPDHLQEKDGKALGEYTVKKSNQI